MISQLFSQFISAWSQKYADIKQLEISNKEQNILIKERSSSEEEYDRNKLKVPLNEYLVYHLLVKELPTQIIEAANYPDDKFKVKGSIASGRIAEIPWLGVFDLGITKSAKEGYYLVYLFRSDMEGFYLSLNQGFTQLYVFKPK